jgi:3D (Asp-Asp-Asp) domain-containing protein
MNASRQLTGLLGTIAALACLNSCALPEGFAGSEKSPLKITGVPLQPGVRYEVRKAIAAGVPFKPQEMKRYYFVVEAPRPPLVAAANIPGRSLTVRTTAYCHDEDDHIVYGAKNALGTPLKFGSVRSAAADWSRYPVGTKFRIAGQPEVTYVVDDYGSALVGTGTIDIYKPTRTQMDAWGVRHVNIEVLQWGSYERSMDIMRDRMKWPHVRQMVRGIQERMYQVKAGDYRGPITAAL